MDSQLLELSLVSMPDLISEFLLIVPSAMALGLLISFVSWAFWYLVRTFRNITQKA